MQKIFTVSLSRNLDRAKLTNGATGDNQIYTYKGVSINVTIAAAGTATSQSNTTATGANLTVGSGGSGVLTPLRIAM